jgi:hypothetical protein
MRLEASITNKQVLDNMMKRLGNRQSPQLREQVLWELNRGIDLLETGATLPWFLEKEYSFQTAVDVVSYDLPADFLREYEEGKLSFYYDGKFLCALDKVAREDLDYVYIGQTGGYSLFAEKLIIAPKPDVVYDCKLEYLAETQEVLDSEAVVSNPWLKNAHAWVTHFALKQVAALHIQDDGMAAKFSALATEAERLVWKAHEARQHANRNYKIED